MGSSVDEQVERAAQGMLTYLSLCPEAAVSVMGIAQWWLPMVKKDLPVEAVQLALDLLVQQDMLHFRTLADGGRIYFAPSIWSARGGKALRPVRPS